MKHKVPHKNSAIALVIGGVVALVLISVFAYSYISQSRAEQARIQAEQARVAAELLRKQQDAQSLMQSAEASISALKQRGIDASELEAKLAQIKANYEGRKYEEINSGFEDVASQSSRLHDEEDSRNASYSAALVNLLIKYQDIERQGVKVATLAGEVASVSAYLEQREYGRMSGSIGSIQITLDKLLAIKKEADKKAAEAARLAAVPAPVAPQSNGGVTYERKVVNTSIGGFTADILTVDMNRVKVKTFTANDNDCAADCPVKPLASFVSENGGIAGINGTYFCPPDYSQCAGVKNSFNTLVFDNKTKKYMNSSQNQYSVNPLISFYPDGAHFYTQALGFGRDTSALGVISNHPTLMHNGGVATNPNLDAKSSSRGVRCGLGFRDKTLWALCVRGVTVNESALVYQALGATYAMNLDGGGSAALYFGGYKVGPGRLLPNAVVFTN